VTEIRVEGKLLNDESIQNWNLGLTRLLPLRCEETIEEEEERKFELLKLSKLKDLIDQSS
jgi:hypothetical protein